MIWNYPKGVFHAHRINSCGLHSRTLHDYAIIVIGLAKDATTVKPYADGHDVTEGHKVNPRNYTNVDLHSCPPTTME